MKRVLSIGILALMAALIVSCATPTPEVITKEIEKIVTQEVEVEKVVTKEVEKVVEVEKEVEVTRVVTEWVYVTPTAEPEPAEPVRGGEMTVTYFQDFGTGFPDVMMNGSSTSHMLASQMYDTLLAFDAAHSVGPNIAKSWEVSEDGTVYTFKLEEGVLFHNGKPLTSADVVYSLNRARDPEISVLASSLEIIESVEALDDYTVQLKTAQAYAPMLDKLAMFNLVILPEGHNPTADEAIGTGPFMMQDLIADEKLTLVRNPNYWNAGDEGLPYLDKVTVNYIGDEMARFGALMSGTSDLIFTPPHSARARLNDDPDFGVFKGFAHWEGIAISTYNVEAFANPLVREAVNVAISRKDIVDVALDGVGIPILGDFTPEGVWYHNDTQYLPLEGDLDRARELLKEAGWEDGFSFTLSTWEQWPTEVKAAQLIQARLAELNIDVTIEHVDPGIWVEKVYEGNIDAAFQGYGTSIEPDTDWRYGVHPKYAYVHNLWDNQTIASMIDQAALELDQDKRAELYKGLVDKLYASGEDTYTVLLMLWREPQDIALNVGRVHGYQDDGFGKLTSLKEMWVTD